MTHRSSCCLGARDAHNHRRPSGRAHMWPFKMPRRIRGWTYKYAKCERKETIARAPHEVQLVDPQDSNDVSDLNVIRCRQRHERRRKTGPATSVISHLEIAFARSAKRPLSASATITSSVRAVTPPQQTARRPGLPNNNEIASPTTTNAIAPRLRCGNESRLHIATAISKPKLELPRRSTEASTKIGEKASAISVANRADDGLDLVATHDM
jgi:hypothetical protein